jgi:hypothetical protein
VAKLKANAVSNQLTQTLGAAISKKVATHGGPSTNVSHALSIPPAPPKSPRSRLWALLQTTVSKRTAQLVDMAGNLRKSIPKAMAKHPVQLGNLGFKSPEELVQYLVAGIAEMETGAKTLAEFNKGIKGWRWNVAGRLLFERLVKFDPRLDRFFRGLAKDFFARISSGAGSTFITLIDGQGNQRRVTPTFGTPEKVVEFKLRGGDGVVRSYSDFGFHCQEPAGRLGFAAHRDQDAIRAVGSR